MNTRPTLSLLEAHSWQTLHPFFFLQFNKSCFGFLLYCLSLLDFIVDYWPPAFLMFISAFSVRAIFLPFLNCVTFSFFFFSVTPYVPFFFFYWRLRTPGLHVRWHVLLIFQVTKGERDYSAVKYRRFG